MFASCQKETSTKKESFTINNEVSEDAKMLSFASEEELHKQVHELKLMSKDDLDKWYLNHDNFSSQHKFMWDVVDELDEATSIEEVKTMQQKYKGLLLFNENEEDKDISPYIPSTNHGTELVCNKYGDVIINGKVHNFNNISSYSQTRDYEMQNMIKTRALNQIPGGYHVEVDKRKFWFEFWHNTNTSWYELRLVAHKKGAFGVWKKYRTSYGVSIDENNKKWIEYGPFAKDIIRDAKFSYYITADMASGDYYPFVRGVQKGAEYAYINVKAYSRGVGEANAGEVQLEVYR